MYYLNRKTLKRSWSWPKNQGLDLELNISPPQDSEGIAGTDSLDDSRKQRYLANSMVAVACLRCHLLVMLSRSSPSCPNCKYVHPLLPPAQQLSPSTVDDSPRSPETLSLLNWGVSRWMIPPFISLSICLSIYLSTVHINEKVLKKQCLNTRMIIHWAPRTHKAVRVVCICTVRLVD